VHRHSCLCLMHFGYTQDPSQAQDDAQTRDEFQTEPLPGPSGALRAKWLTAILISKRPAVASEVFFGRGRFVFSSSDDLKPAIATTVARERRRGSSLRGIAQSLFATIFPSECRLCDAFLTNISRLPVCNECVSAVSPLSGIFCAVCGERLPSQIAESDGLCALCRKEAPLYTVAAAYGSYETGLRDLIHLLKYDKVRPAANVLGNMLAEVIAKMQPAFAGGTIFVAPVPLHSGKLRERGFNQAELIARAALKHPDVNSQFKLNASLLKRRRVTESQIGLSQNQRKENLRGAFIVTSPSALAGREVLLVDDVFTTGTTASECARVMRRAGASKVWVATVARTLKKNVQTVQVFEDAPAAMAG
jgi:ComF family protein